jgi:hypothetical protein
MLSGRRDRSLAARSTAVGIAPAYCTVMTPFMFIARCGVQLML